MKTLDINITNMVIANTNMEMLKNDFCIRIFFYWLFIRLFTHTLITFTLGIGTQNIFSLFGILTELCY